MVIVVAEQFRADYLDLYRSGFSPDGFGRLLSEGAVFRRARFKHLTTLGAPNAAVSRNRVRILNCMASWETAGTIAGSERRPRRSPLPVTARQTAAFRR